MKPLKSRGFGHPLTGLRRFVLVLSVLFVPTLVHAQVPAPGLDTLVAPGDQVIVTLWTGGKVRGRVVQVTDCGIGLAGSAQLRTIPADLIKTLRRRPPTKENAGATFALEIAEECRDVECLPGALLYVGAGAIIQGLADLSHPPKVVYRAKRRLGPSDACSGSWVSAGQERIAMR